MRLSLKNHIGVILEPSENGFDEGATTFASCIRDPKSKDFVLFYTGASKDWETASIGKVTSEDGIHFSRNLDHPFFSHGIQSLTPLIFQALGFYWMAFSYRASPKEGRSLGLANTRSLTNKWNFIGKLISPQNKWEGLDIDLGPSIVEIDKKRFIIYYSNVSNKGVLRHLLGPRYLYRRIGILELQINGLNDFSVKRCNRNPLSNLNGKKGEWNESTFCPGYFKKNNQHFLLPACSTYSIGHPFKQYIGLMTSDSSSFQRISSRKILLNGPKEKENIIPGIRSEIALDSPCPILVGEELWLYYSVMDRSNKIWKTALSIYEIE